MKAWTATLGLCFAATSFAQSVDNNNAQSSASTSAVGNAQSITFVSPAESHSTQNINNISSGTTKSVVEYAGSYTLKNVPSVSGPNLTTSNDTCMGSSSGSANGPGFGVSFGSTWTDEHCKRLKMSRELWNKGMKAASLAIDCMDPTARVALEITGSKCPQSMTLDERRSNYGANASAEGAPVEPGMAANPAPIGGSQLTSAMQQTQAEMFRN